MLCNCGVCMTVRDYIIVTLFVVIILFIPSTCKLSIYQICLTLRHDCRSTWTALSGTSTTALLYMLSSNHYLV